MTRDELLKIHEDLTSKARNLMKKKNADYAGNDGLEPFANFTRVEAMGICTTEQGFLVRMTDKMSRLSSFVESGKLAVENESFEDTLVDVVNYAVLMYAYIHGKNTKSTPVSVHSEPSHPFVPKSSCCKHTKNGNGRFEEFINNPWTDTTANPSTIERSATS